MTSSRQTRRVVRRHDPQYPPNYEVPSPAKLLSEQRTAMLQQAVDQGWGAITGEVVSGDRIIFSFENGAQLSVNLPPGSKTEGADVPRPEPMYGYSVEPAPARREYRQGPGDIDRMRAERQGLGQALPWDTEEDEY